MIVCLNGRYLDHRKARISPLDNGFLYGDGFYDTMRTYKGKILELDLHLKRIEKSAGVAGIALPVSLRTLGMWIEETVKQNTVSEARVRITITRGEHGFDFLTTKKATVLVTCEPIVLDTEIYRKGVSVYTLKLERVLPDLKTIGLTTMMVAYRNVHPRGGYEAILVDRAGFVREGASTNVFVVKNGKIYTPKTKILSGRTRNAVIEICKKNRIPCVVKDFKVPFLRSADEVFLTNRPREVIPVVRLDDKKIGSGKVGVITRSVMDLYRKHVELELSL